MTVSEFYSKRKVIMHTTLSELAQEIDSHPFSGLRENIYRGEHLKVRLKHQDELHFGETSLCGKDPDAFYSMMEEDGVRKDMVYECYGFEGFGDVYVEVEKGILKSFCECFFVEAMK